MSVVLTHKVGSSTVDQYDAVDVGYNVQKKQRSTLHNDEHFMTKYQLSQLEIIHVQQLKHLGKI